jgi:hypothetical protein
MGLTQIADAAMRRGGLERPERRRLPRSVF